MQIHKLAPTHIAQVLYSAIREAEEANEIIESISLTDTEFAQLINCETVKNTKSKWYGSNEGGFVMTDILMRDVTLSENGESRVERLPVSCYFCGVKITRGSI